VPSHKRLVETFYRELWNEWNDSAVEDILDPEFEFRASLGVATVGYEGWRAYRDAIRAGSEDFHNEIVALVGDGRARQHGCATPEPTPARCWE
jgi:hypothetical protein